MAKYGSEMHNFQSIFSIISGGAYFPIFHAILFAQIEIFHDHQWSGQPGIYQEMGMHPPPEFKNKSFMVLRQKMNLKGPLLSPFSQNFPGRNAPIPPQYDSRFTNKRFKCLWEKMAPKITVLGPFFQNFRGGMNPSMTRGLQKMCLVFLTKKALKCTLLVHFQKKKNSRREYFHTSLV